MHEYCMNGLIEYLILLFQYNRKPAHKQRNSYHKSVTPNLLIRALMILSEILLMRTDSQK